MLKKKKKWKRRKEGERVWVLHAAVAAVGSLQGAEHPEVRQRRDFGSSAVSGRAYRTFPSPVSCLCLLLDPFILPRNHPESSLVRRQRGGSFIQATLPL